MIVVFGKQKEKNNNRRMYTLYLYLSSNQIVPFPVAYLSQIIAKLTSTISGRKKQKRLDNDVLLNRQIRKKKIFDYFRSHRYNNNKKNTQWKNLSLLRLREPRTYDSRITNTKYLPIY